MELNSAKESTNNVTRNGLHELDRQEDSTLSEPHPVSSVRFEPCNLLDQSCFDPEGEATNSRLQPHAGTELNDSNVSRGYISNQELLLQRSPEENSTFSEESQGVDSSPGFTPYRFLAAKASSDHTDITDQLSHFMPELTNNEDWGEESDPDNEDAGETSDTELVSSCGSVGHSPGKSKVLNRPFFRFDQGQEEIEMKKFSWNNLSKANLKSTEFPVFNEDHFLNQEISSLCSNQLGDAHNEDGCSLNGDQEAECGVQGNNWVDPGYKFTCDLKGKSLPSDL